MIELQFPWAWWEHSSRGTAETELLHVKHLGSGKPFRVPELKCDHRAGLRGQHPRCHAAQGTLEAFHKWLKSQTVPLEGYAERTSLSSGRNRQCALPHWSANCPSPNTGVQPLLYTTIFFSRRSNLRSINPLNVILFSVCVPESSNLPLQILLSLNLLPIEHENLTDSKILKQKKVLNGISSPLTSKRAI